MMDPNETQGSLPGNVDLFKKKKSLCKDDSTKVLLGPKYQQHQKTKEKIKTLRGEKTKLENNYNQRKELRVARPCRKHRAKTQKPSEEPNEKIHWEKQGTGELDNAIKATRGRTKVEDKTGDLQRHEDKLQELGC